MTRAELVEQLQKLAPHKEYIFSPYLGLKEGQVLVRHQDRMYGRVARSSTVYDVDVDAFLGRELAKHLGLTGRLLGARDDASPSVLPEVAGAS